MSMQHEKSWLLVLGLIVSGCGPREDPSRRICDGSTEVRAAVQVVGGQLSSEQILRVENGHFFFFIDGTCRFAVKAQSQGEVRTGTLTAAEEEALAAKLGYRAWAGFDGNWSGAPGAHDASTLRLWDHRYLASCYAGCGDTAPKELRELSESLGAFLTPYWEQGTPYRGEAMRLLVVDDIRTTHAAYEWPLMTLASTFMLPEGQYPDVGRSFEIRGDDADALRSIQADFLESASEMDRDQPIPILTAEGERLGMLLREALPWEDDAGLVQQRPRR